MKIETFQRDKEDKLIPVIETIDTRSAILKAHLLTKENALKNYAGKNKLKKLGLKSAVASLKKEYEASGDFEEILICPIMNYEFDLLSKGLGLDGKECADQTASVLATKCIKPEFTYESARDMKDHTLKNKILDKITFISTPKLKQETLKKIAAILEKTR